MSTADVLLQRANSITLVPLPVSWDVRTAAPGVFRALCDQDSKISDLLTAIECGSPVARSSRPFTDDPYRRPIGHARSFYLRTEDGGVLGFKGTEPLSDDRASTLHAAWDLRTGFAHSPLEHFLLVENEPYLGMTAPAALYCATISAEWASAYLERFGELPRTPIPLLTLRIPAGLASSFVAATRPLLTDRGQLSALERFDHLVARDLGVYIYYYPTLPLRAAHAAGSFPGASGINFDPERDGFTFDIDQALEGWLELFAEMLVLGYLPTTPVHTGNCVQTHNLVVDGGFCDLDSLQKMTDIAHEKDFFGALVYSMNTLTSAVGFLLHGAAGERAAQGLIYAGLWQEVRRRTLAVSKGTSLDPRLKAIVSADGVAALRMAFGGRSGLVGSPMAGAQARRPAGAELPCS